MSNSEISIKSYTRRTRSGKTTQVKAHTRKGRRGEDKGDEATHEKGKEIEGVMEKFDKMPEDTIHYGNIKTEKNRGDEIVAYARKVRERLDRIKKGKADREAKEAYQKDPNRELTDAEVKQYENNRNASLTNGLRRSEVARQKAYDKMHGYVSAQLGQVAKKTPEKKSLIDFDKERSKARINRGGVAGMEEKLASWVERNGGKYKRNV